MIEMESNNSVRKIRKSKREIRKEKVDRKYLELFEEIKKLDVKMIEMKSKLENELEMWIDFKSWIEKEGGLEIKCDFEDGDEDEL